MRTSMVAIAALALALALAWACGGDPRSGADATADGGGPPAVPEPTRFDILWVVDDSSSMCQEQVALARAVTEGLLPAAREDGLDLRMAVVTTNVASADRRGRFNTRPARDFPFDCVEARSFPAWSDLHCACAACAGFAAAWDVQTCADAAGCEPDEAGAPAYAACLAAGGCAADPAAGDWRADAWGGGLEWLYNGNGSVNGFCRYDCGLGDGGAEAADARCAARFGADSVCVTPEGTVLSGCLAPPATAGCPDGSGPVLPRPAKGAEVALALDDFRCIGVVGVDTRNPPREVNLEQGLAAAWLALDPAGPNADQVCDPADPAASDPALTPAQRRERCERAFLRDGAGLVLVFLSDEDDCSLADGKTVDDEDVNRCAWLGDPDTPEDELVERESHRTSRRPLEPVATFVERFRSLRPNPTAVLAVAITGDAKGSGEAPPTEAEREAARAAFLQAVQDRANPMRTNTSICHSDHGRASYGRRYIDLAASFGKQGLFMNICDPDWTAPLVALLRSSAAR